MKAIEMLELIEELHINRFKQDPGVYAAPSMRERFSLSQLSGNIADGLSKDEIVYYVMAKTGSSTGATRNTFMMLDVGGFIERKEGTRRYKPVPMKSNLLASVNDMNLNFGFFDPEDRRRGVDFEDITFLAHAVKEELAEFLTAQSNEDELDALIDLSVFIIGTAVKGGYGDVFNEAFRRVMVANNNKTVGPQVKRGSYKKDLIKAPTWTAATFKDLL